MNFRRIREAATLGSDSVDVFTDDHEYMCRASSQQYCTQQLTSHQLSDYLINMWAKLSQKVSDMFRNFVSGARGNSDSEDDGVSGSDHEDECQLKIGRDLAVDHNFQSKLLPEQVTPPHPRSGALEKQLVHTVGSGATAPARHVSFENLEAELGVELSNDSFPSFSGPCAYVNSDDCDEDNAHHDHDERNAHR